MNFMTHRKLNWVHVWKPWWKRVDQIHNIKWWTTADSGCHTKLLHSAYNPNGGD